MTSARIVYTRPDGGVTVGKPTQWCLDMLANGGFWAGKPRAWLDEQIERGIRAGRNERAVRRYLRAMQEGGCTTAEAYEIIRDRDFAHMGTGHELWQHADLPDRWFRDAWRRSHNGGPIFIDLAAARRQQFKRIRWAADRENARRQQDLDLCCDPIVLPLGEIRDRIHKAESADELRRIWPDALAR